MRCPGEAGLPKPWDFGEKMAYSISSIIDRSRAIDRVLHRSSGSRYRQKILVYHRNLLRVLIDVSYLSDGSFFEVLVLVTYGNVQGNSSRTLEG